jgi:hypothetical protein
MVRNCTLIFVLFVVLLSSYAPYVYIGLCWVVPTLPYGKTTSKGKTTFTLTGYPTSKGKTPFTDNGILRKRTR